MSTEAASEISAIHEGFQRFLIENLSRHGIGPFFGFMLGHRAQHYKFVQEYLAAGLKNPNSDRSVLDQILEASPLEYLRLEERAMKLLLDIPIAGEGQS